MKQLEKLMLTIGLLDRVSGPVRNIGRTIDQVTNHSRKAFMNTAAGVTALIAASSTFAATVNPANDLNNAVKEVSSLEVADDTLKKLNQSGLQYSIQFGDTAANYVRSAYDIQSAINGLSGDDLPQFTTASGVLAKATKANVSDITSYVGTMYGIFKKNAEQMGRGEWVEMLAGQTATAVQMFKTTGPEMKSAFESLGAGGEAMGVKLSEQMAVLGTLQASMSGSEAGTKYGAFLEGLAGARDDLGLNFTDSSGQLLPVVDILQKIKGEMKGMGALDAQSFLAGSFDDEAVAFIQLMSQDLGKLNTDIGNLGKQKGMEKAIWMAERMQDPWARLGAGVSGVSIAIWQKALPVIEPYINKITELTSSIVAWTDKYPYLFKAVGLAAAGMMAFMVVAGGALVLLGGWRFAMIGLTLMLKMTGVGFIAANAKAIIFGGGMKVARLAMWSFLLYGPRVTAFFTMMKAGLLSSVPVIYAFSAALLANPLTWVVLGVVALVGAIVGLIYYWDEVTAAVSNGWSWLKGLFEDNEWMKVVFSPLYNLLGAVDTVIGEFGKIPKWWESLQSWFAGLSFEPVWELGGDLIGGLSQEWGNFQVWLSGLSLIPAWDLGVEAFESIKTWWSDFKTWFVGLNPFEGLFDSFSGIQGALSWLPGVDDPTQGVSEKLAEQNQSVGALVLPGAAVEGSEKSGGIFETISNIFGGSSNSTHVEKIEVINTGAPMRGEDLMHEIEMAAG